jgi:hypothetical protein
MILKLQNEVEKIISHLLIKSVVFCAAQPDRFTFAAALLMIIFGALTSICGQQIQDYNNMSIN